jgi:thiopeptide-type bacteriocin biosynthesis protein
MSTISTLNEDRGIILQTVADLVSGGFLLTNLWPSGEAGTGDEATLARISDTIPSSESVRAMKDIIDTCRVLNVTQWDTWEEKLVDLSIAYKEAHSDNLFSKIQVQAKSRSKTASMPKSVGFEVSRGAELLLRLSSGPDGPQELQAFKKPFQEMWEGRETPLLELFDPVWGTFRLAEDDGGFDHALPRAPEVSERDRVLTDLAADSLARGKVEIALETDLIRKLQTWDPLEHPVPPSLELGFCLLAESATSLNHGHFRVLLNYLTNPHADMEMSRFAHLLPEREVSLADRHILNHSNVMEVELRCAPTWEDAFAFFVGPSTKRPRICYGLVPRDGDAERIPLGEIVVGIAHGSFYLRWPRRATLLRPFLNFTVNPRMLPDVCRFLEMVGREGVPTFHPFDWGPVGSYPFLPRISSGRLILSRARWSIGPDTPEWNRLDVQPEAFPRAWAEWMRTWNVPERVFMQGQGFLQYLDFSDPLDVSVIRKVLNRTKPGERVSLLEALPTWADGWSRNSSGTYHIEGVVSCAVRSQASALRRYAKPIPIALDYPYPDIATVSYPPSSQWLYLKLCAHQEDEDELIGNHVFKIMSNLSDEGAIDSWFFVRYADPRTQLRVRLHGASKAISAMIIPRACQWASSLVSKGLVQSFSMETYEPEVSRYGGVSAMRLAERVFHVDSVLLSKCLVTIGESEIVDQRAMIACALADDILATFGYSPISKLDWYRALKRDASDSPAINPRNDRLAKSILAILSGNESEREKLLSPGIALLLRDRARTLTGAADDFHRLESSGSLSVSLPIILMSLVHMDFNRIGIGRAQERTLETMLWRASEHRCYAHQLPDQPTDSGR